MKTIVRLVCIILLILGLYPPSIFAQASIYTNSKLLGNIKSLVIESESEVVLCLSDSSNYISFIDEDEDPIPFDSYIHYDVKAERLIISSSGKVFLCLSPNTKLERIDINGNASLKAKSQLSTIFADTVLLNLTNTSDVTLGLQTKEVSVSTSEASDANLRIDAQNVNIWASQASNVNIILNSENVYLALSSASDAVLEGNVENMKALLSGTSDLNATKLKVSKLDLYTSGLSTAKIKADSVINSYKMDEKIDRIEKVEKENEGSGKPMPYNLDLNTFSRKGLKNERNKFRGHWMGIEAGYNYYTRASDPNILMDIDYGKSGSFAWNVFQYSVGFNSRHVGFVTGAGFLWNNYRFQDTRTIPYIQDGKFAVKLDDDPNRFYDKSKLTVSYFRIPLLFEYTNAKKYWSNFHISVGAIAGVRMCTWSKQIYKIQGQSGNEKSKSKSDYYVNPLRFDLVSYIGIGPINFYFSYAATDLFLKNKGPEVTPFAFGFMLGFN